MTEIRNSILAGIAFGFLFGIYLAFRLGIYYALIYGPISGLLFGSALYFFVTSKMFEKRTQIQIAEGEKIIHSDRANHFVQGKAVGGKLYLLSDRIQFQSFQSHKQIISLKQIEKINFYNTLELIPNGLAVATLDGQTEKFAVNDRQNWKKQIEKLMENISESK